MKKPLLLACAAFASAFAFTGCIGLHLGVGGGGGSRSTVKNNSTTYDATLGQQLLDLQKAYDAGVISKSEYDHQKKKLLKHYM